MRRGEGLHPIAERCRGLTKQIDLAAKLAGRAIDTAVKELDARESDLWVNAEVNRARRAWSLRGPGQWRRCGGRGTS